MLIMAVLLLALLFLSHTMISLAENIINIDCGASAPYLSSWVGDEGFATTGKTLTSGVNVDNKSLKPLLTLRFFPSGDKNCYSNIPATRVGKTFVRTKFFYRNYGKSSPPSFNVVYDEKHLDKVVFDVPLLKEKDMLLSISEVIFTPASEKISVCLIRTSPSDHPFISSIEVYAMDASMYNNIGPKEGLILRKRFAYASEKDKSYYPLDPYGRLWYPVTPNDSGTSELLKVASPIDINAAHNKPPEFVMLRAFSEDVIRFSGKTLPLDDSPMYLAAYFSEPQSLDRTQKRSFNVFLDNEQQNSDPIIPVFGEAAQFVKRDIVATSLSEVIFRSTSDSTLPPIVSAIELYSISKGDGADIGIGGGWLDKPERGRNKPDDKASQDLKEAAKKITKENKNMKPKLPVILGASFGSAFVAISSVFAAIFCKRSRNAKSQSNTEPATSTAEAGVEPLVGKQSASDVSHPGNAKPDAFDPNVVHKHGAA